MFKKPISATDLAKLGMCENLIILRKKHGVKETKEQRRRIKFGNWAHQQHDKDVKAYQSRPCYVATYLYGEDNPIVQDLRTIRDTRLLPHPVGGVFVELYYRLSPGLLKTCRTLPVLNPGFRLAIRIFRWWFT